MASDTKLDAQGRDGSFMRLFRFISGENTKQQKIAMATPVFMECTGDLSDVTMSFVLPKGVASGDVPEPAKRSRGIHFGSLTGWAEPTKIVNKSRVCFGL